MKLNKFVAGLAIAAGAFSISSCSEDFEVAAPYKDVTVVYGMLNVDDAAQYIRIQKVFMDENKSAIDLAKIADSSYYRNIEVHVKGLNGANVIFDDILPKVDMANENLPKYPGTFFDSPSYAYKLSRALNAAYTYRLVVKNLETGNVDSAETNIINTNPANVSGNFFVSFFSLTNPKLAFNNVISDNNFRLSVNAPTNAKYLEAFIRIKYASQIGSGPQIDSSFIWHFASGIVVDPNTAVSLVTPRSSLYSVLSDNIKVAPINVTRYLDSADVFVWAANDNFYNYMLVNAAQGGITADQIKTNYTNVKSKNGALGLFASRAVRIRYNIPFDLTTMDSIKRNNLTKGLNFAGFADH